MPRKNRAKRRGRGPKIWGAPAALMEGSTQKPGAQGGDVGNPPPPAEDAEKPDDDQAEAALGRALALGTSPNGQTCPAPGTGFRRRRLGRGLTAAAPHSLSRFSRQLSDIIAETAPAVVSVRNQSVCGGHSGRIRIRVCRIRPGFVVTSAHLLRRADAVSITYSDGGEAAAVVRGVDLQTDLAVLAHRAPKNKAAGRGRSEASHRRRTRGRDRQSSFAARHRHLGSRLPTDRRLTRAGRTLLDGVIQTDAAVAPGSSGGALLGMDRRLVGIVVAHNLAHAGISFAVPSSPPGGSRMISSNGGGREERRSA